LCARCNGALARFMDDITNLRRAVRYMKLDGQKVTRILEDSSLEAELPDREVLDESNS
ncbi:hypothetical protein LCGC14_2971060, partial [marine sediment metagenome]